MQTNTQSVFPRNKSAGGYTLIETVVTITIAVFLLAAGFSLYTLERSSRFENQMQNMFAELRQMQSKARTVDANLEYGMSFSPTSWTTFSRDTGTGVQTNIQTRQLSAMTLSWSINPASTQVVFQRLTGNMFNGTTATITGTITNPNRTQSIRIESNGVMYVQ